MAARCDPRLAAGFTIAECFAIDANDRYVTRLEQALDAARVARDAAADADCWHAYEGIKRGVRLLEDALDCARQVAER